MSESDAWPWVEFACPDVLVRDRLLAELDGGDVAGCEERDARDAVALRVYWEPTCSFETVMAGAARFAQLSGAHVREHGVQGREDWLQQWKEHFHPLKITEHLWVCPPWELPSPAPHEQVIVINPQMAFGTGHHPTTRLCVQYLERYVRPGARVLDVGTGSGILAIAAAKLGAGSVLAVEPDPEACRNARENLDRNDAGRVVTLLEETFGTDGSHDAEVVVCNIITDRLLPLLPALAASASDGILILSGISEDHRAEVLEAVRDAGLTIDREEVRDEWWVCACTLRG